MAYADLNRTVTAGFPALSAPRFLAPLVAWYQAAQTRKTLAALTDRELEDIGLARADIETVVSRVATR